MFKRLDNGRLTPTRRGWFFIIGAFLIICVIGWNTQSTANKVDAQARDTLAFAEQTNDCLTDVINVLTTRVGYNDEIGKLDLRRQAIWENLVSDLSLSEGNGQLNREALDRFFEANEIIKVDQAKLAQQREANQYPDCSQDLP